MTWPFTKKAPPAATPAASDIVTVPRKFTHNEHPLGTQFFSDQDYANRHAKAMDRSFRRSHNQLKVIGFDGADKNIAMDTQMKTAMDNNISQVKSAISQNHGFLPIHVLEWYSNQGFIGWQICAILAQNWLVNKACKMPGQDAVRHGFERTVNKGVELEKKVFDDLRALDKRYKLKNNLIEHYKFARVFGLRHTLFIVDGIDYELPFNIDGVKPGSYRGMTQIDPYWLAPMFSFEDASDAQSPNFYNPTWWMINGKKIHRTHFVISRNGNELADILKPTYFYGGLSTTQLMYERVYAGERTANEAPLLAMTKRLFVLTTDTTKAMNDLDTFMARLTQWMQVINNFGVKVLGLDEEVQQIDTSLAEFNQTIITQYELAAAEAEVPAAKLLGTSPKGGLGSEGTYDADSYHEFLESIQELELSPIVERHTMLCQRSHEIAPDVNMEIIWNATDSPTAKEQAEINKIKAETDVALVNAGSIDGVDSRERLISDKDSGYNGIEAITEPFSDEEESGGEPDGGGENDTENSEQTLAKDEMLQGYWDAALGQFNGARIITHQRFLNPDKIKDKVATKDFMVNVTPEFYDDGKKYRMVIDGHHSLAAAMECGVAPVFCTDLPRDSVFNAATRLATDKKDKL